MPAIDLGVTQTKVSGPQGMKKFDSLVAPLPYNEVLWGSGTSGKHVVVGSTVYTVGASALLDGEGAIYPARRHQFDVTDHVRWIAALSLLDPKDPVHIYSGLPVDEYRDLKGPFVEAFTGTHSGYEVSGVTLLPQGAGVYYASILDPNGGVANKERAAHKVLVLDFGGRTVNVLTFQNGKYVVLGSFTIYTGIVNVYQRLARILNGKFGTALNLYEARLAMMKGVLTLGNDKVPIRAEIEEAIVPVWQEISDTLQMMLPNWRTYQEVVLGGGASPVFRERVEALFPGIPAFMLPKPDFGNVLGYDWYGRLVERGGIPT